MTLSEDEDEIARCLGRHRFDGLYTCPRVAGVVQIDFQKRRFEMDVVPVYPPDEAASDEGSPNQGAGTLKADAALDFALREFPFMSTNSDAQQNN
jgi:hypothetical protein